MAGSKQPPGLRLVRIASEHFGLCTVLMLSSKAHDRWLSAIALLALGLRCYELGTESIWLDEAVSIQQLKAVSQDNHLLEVPYAYYARRSDLSRVSVPEARSGSEPASSALLAALLAAFEGRKRVWLVSGYEQKHPNHARQVATTLSSRFTLADGRAFGRPSLQLFVRKPKSR